MVFLGQAPRSVHIIDPDYRRRARVAREIGARRLHVEIYEDLNEFKRTKPQRGVVFAAEAPCEDSCSDRISQVVDTTKGEMPLVVYAHHPTPERIVNAMLAGALDYLEWPFNPLLLDAAFERLATEGGRKAEQARLRTAAKAKIEALSPREREVLILLIRGLSNKEMAEELKISPRTVEIHRGNMMGKLHANSASDAVRMGLFAELLER
jgi:two-component system, LuxR family, response regulator FixJ